ncbi:hypothetical protein RHSIM_Rhsim07G0070600 [Rhododendron simsii]|uniref:Uncharacterized protein n=1 Tax=Rhododendron simsii TaxID=118357 RepID=A0A834GP11_RHOSS|nr:hypothetical protein RHSIM_Rhsim07G0070600 [Rhododendron simsii]
MESTTASTRSFSPKSSSLIPNSFHSFLKPSKTHLPAIAHLHLKYFTNTPTDHFKTTNTTRPGFSIVQTRATVDETDRVADSRLLVDQEEEEQPNREVEKCVKVLKNAAKTRQVAAKEVLSALSVMEKAKLDPSGFLETLGGLKSPGRTWMLIFTAKNGLKSGGYIPLQPSRGLMPLRRGSRMEFSSDHWGACHLKAGFRGRRENLLSYLSASA